MSAGQRRRRSSQGLTLAAARRRSSAAAWAAALEASASGYEGEDKPVLRREEFICSDSHNAHLHEDFLEDKSRLFGRPLPSPAQGRSRSSSNAGGLKHVSSERLLRKFFHSAADTQSLRSVPDDRVPAAFLETVREEPKSPTRVDGNSATAKLQEAAAQPTTEIPTASSTSTPPPSKPPRKIWRRSKRTSSRGQTEAGPKPGPEATSTPISNGNCPRAETPKPRVGEEDAPTTYDDRLDDDLLSTRTNRKPETVLRSTSGSIRSGRLIRQNSSRRPLSSSDSEESACKLYKRASLTHSRAPDAGETEESPTANCVAPDRPRRIKRESLIHPPIATRREMALGTGTLAMPTFHNGRFGNPWPTWRKPSIWAAIKWKLTTKNHTALPTSEKELDLTLPIMALSRDIQTPPQDGIRVTWMGHATTLVQFDDISVMTDPMMSERASPSTVLGPKRFRRFPGTVHDLPKLDAVVISHNHYDHLDYNSVVLLNARFGADLHWFVPLGLGSWLRNTGCQSVTELSWWGEGSLPQNGATAFVFTPAQHWSKRTITDDNRSLWGSWCILGPRHRFFFAGDTGYCTGFREIGEQYGPFDLAAIPIGAYEPRSMMGPQHVDPEQAVKIHQDVRAKRSVGIHWGTFALASEYYLDPPRRLAEEVDKAGLAKEDFFVLKHGESRLFVRL